MKYMHSIGYILWEQGEFQRSVEVYSEALHMHRSVLSSYQHPNGYIDVDGTLYAMGVLRLQMY